METKLRHYRWITLWGEHRYLCGAREPASVPKEINEARTKLCAACEKERPLHEQGCSTDGSLYA